MSSIAVGREEKAGAPEIRSWLLMVVLVAGHAIKHIYGAGFLLLLPEMRIGLNLSNADIGSIATARALAGGLTNLPAGFLADRFNQRWPIILGLTMIVIGAFQFIMGSTGNFAAIVLCIIIVGATISFWHPPAIAALSQRFAHRKGLAISMHGTGGSIGEALGPVCVGALLAVMTWQGVLQFSLGPALIAGVTVWVLTRNIQASGASTLTMATYGASLRNLTRSPALRTVMLVTAIAAMATGAFVTFLPVYLRIDLGYSPAEASAFIFASQVAGIASQPVMGQLSDRFGRIRVVIPSLLVLATGMLAVSMAPAGWPLAAAVALVGVFQFPSIALFLAAAMDHVGSETQAITVSLVYGASFLASSVSPSIAGRLADSLGMASVFVFAGVLALSALGVLALRHASLRLPGR